MALPTGPVRLGDAVAARELLRDVITRTPMLHSWVLSDRLGGPGYLKCENPQPTGSFKVPGPDPRISRLPPQERPKSAFPPTPATPAPGLPFPPPAPPTQR